MRYGVKWEFDMFEVEMYSYGQLLLQVSPSNCPKITTFSAAMQVLGKTRESIKAFYKKQLTRVEKEDAERRKDWEEWFWGSERPKDLDAGPVVLERQSS